MSPTGRLLALTRGDPSGIGLEIALKAWAALRGEPGVDPFLLVEDLAHAQRTTARLGLDVPLVATTAAAAAAVFPDALPILPLETETRGVPGKPDAADAPGTIASMTRCVELVAAGSASAVVTLPISKEVLHRVGFAHPGHTEFMGELAARFFRAASTRPVMLLWSPQLAVVPTTIHVPISAVPGLVTGDLIVATVRIVARDLRTRFGLAMPRIAVAGLNPHASEGGDIGREDLDVVAPALDVLRAEGIAVTGPHPADTLFHAAARARYDVAVTMYHDQALIPIKTLAFDSAVNVTLGLPFVRTSPDHGTAFDIAGRGIADAASLIAALRLAGGSRPLTAGRQREGDAPRRPWPMNDYEKGGRAIRLIGGQEKRAIVIVPYREEWPARFEHHARRIATTLGTTALRIEHIGSTAVEGLSAKPIIDILVAVSDPSREELYLNEMLFSGYELRVREPDFEEHRMFRTPERDVHVHVYPETSREVGRYLIFRDYLRANPTVRDRYAALKRELSKRDWADMNQYADAKTDFIESVIDQAHNA